MNDKSTNIEIYHSGSGLGHVLFCSHYNGIRYIICNEYIYDIVVCDMVGCDIVGCNMVGYNMVSYNMIGCDMVSSNMVGCDIVGCEWLAVIELDGIWLAVI